jgi:hypothetical protein
VQFSDPDSAGPRNLSDGKPHLAKTWRWLENELYAFGGATRAPHLYPGWYIDPDTAARVHDRSRKYFVAVARQHLDELRRLLRRACGEFRQKCIYLSVAGRVEFVEGEGDAAT